MNWWLTIWYKILLWAVRNKIRNIHRVECNMSEQARERIANLICEDCDHQGKTKFPCAKELPCVYAEGLTDQILSAFHKLGYRHIPELTVLSDEEILNAYPDGDMPEDDPIFGLRQIALAQLSHTKKEIDLCNWAREDESKICQASIEEIFKEIDAHVRMIGQEDWWQNFKSKYLKQEGR